MKIGPRGMAACGKEGSSHYLHLGTEEQNQVQGAQVITSVSNMVSSQVSAGHVKICGDNREASRKSWNAIRSKRSGGEIGSCQFSKYGW